MNIYIYIYIYIYTHTHTHTHKLLGMCGPVWNNVEYIFFFVARVSSIPNPAGYIMNRILFNSALLPVYKMTESRHRSKK